MDRDVGLLLDWLADHDESCPICTYNVRGVTHPACPECGASLRLAVRSPAQRYMPWIAAMLAFAFAAGFDLVFGAVFAVVTSLAPTGPTPAAVLRVGVLAGVGAVCLAGIWFVARRRTAIMRLPVRSQWAVAALVAGAVFVLHLAHGYWIMRLIL